MNSKMQLLLKSYLDLLPMNPNEYIDHNHHPDTDKRGAHLAWMINQMLLPTDEHLKSKMDNPLILNRWLGFIQGALWSNGLRSIQQLRDETRGLN